MSDQWCRYCWTTLYLKDKPFIVMFSQSFLMAFGWILVHTCSGMRARSIRIYFDSSSCNWMYFKLYLKCSGICKRTKWNWISDSPSQVELMLDDAERERLGNPRQPEKPIIRLRVRNCSAWIALFLKVTLKSFKAKSCFLCKHIIYTFFLLCTGKCKSPTILLFTCVTSTLR